MSAISALHNDFARPLQQVFDFQRASGVSPGETVSLIFSMPPELAAVVDAETGEATLGAARLSVRIGGSGGMNTLRGSLTITAPPGPRRVVSAAPPMDSEFRQ
jgi:hypothetical protein